MTVTVEQVVEARFSYDPEDEPFWSPNFSDAAEHLISSGAVVVFIPAVKTHR